MPPIPGDGSIRQATSSMLPRLLLNTLILLAHTLRFSQYSLVIALRCQNTLTAGIRKPVPLEPK